MSEIKATRRGVLKSGIVLGAGVAMPTILTRPAAAYTNEPQAAQ